MREKKINIKKIKGDEMKKLFLVTMAMVLVLGMAAAARAEEAQFPQREMKGIKTLAEIYFPNKRVNFYKNRVFIRDNAGYVLTFKVNQREVSNGEIDGRLGYEGIATLFLIAVSDYLQHPARGPLGFGENVVIKKIGDLNKLPDREPSAGMELGRDLLK